MKSLSSQQGFTLLELLIAVAIFAVMAAMAYAGLHSVIRGRATVEDHLVQLHELQQTYSLMERDFTQAASRPIKDKLGGKLPALLAEPNGHALSLTRAGYPNPAQMRRSHLLRVSYKQAGQKLLRIDWPVLDRAPGDKPEKVVLLRDLKRLQFHLIDSRGGMQTYWPPVRGSAAGLPEAIKVTLQLQGMTGPVTWWFAVH